MIPFDVHARSLDVGCSHMLEASAGTGKTYSIQHIVTRLLISKEIPLHQILIVTFTRAATRELKNRIRENVEKALHALQKKQAREDYLIAILENGEAEIAKARMVLKEALVCFDEAPIFTIHSFCQKMLAEHAFEGKIPFLAEASASSSRKQMAIRCVADALRTIPESAFSLFQLRHFLSKKFSLESLAGSLDSLEEVQEERSCLYAESLQSIASCLEKLPPIDPEHFLKDCAAFRKCYNGLKGSHIDHQIEILAQMAATRACLPQDVEILLEGKTFFLEQLQDSFLRAKARPPMESELSYPQLFPLLRASLLPEIDRLRDPERVVEYIRGKAHALLDKKGEGLSFDALISAMHQAIGTPLFKQRIQERFRAAIIDEFQDTDPLQWEIFSQLFGTEKHIMYLVGDPKQSIYGFRAADVYTYLKAPEEIPFLKRGCLNTNYRSQPSLMGALNRLFLHGKWLDLPKQQTFIPYEKVHSAQSEDSHLFKDALGALHCMLAAEDPMPRRRFPSLSTESSTLFPAIADAIIRLNAREGISLDGIAILIKDRFQGRRLQGYLAERGIPSLVKRKKPLRNSLSLEILIDIAHAIGQPDSLAHIKKALLSTIWRYSLADVSGAWENPLIQQAKALFAELHLLFFEIDFFQGMEAFLRSRWGDCAIIEILIENGREEIFQEWRQILCILTESSPASLSTLPAAIYALEKYASSPGEEEDGLYSVPGSGHAVTLMTSHMSKGLEYEVVFALGLCQRDARRHADFEEEEEEEEKNFSSEEAQAEKLRLLYVALTRAKKRVYLIGALQREEKDIPLEMASPFELYCSKILSSPQVHLNAVQQFFQNLSAEVSLTFEILEKKNSSEILPSSSAGFPLASADFSKPHSLKTLSFSSLMHAFKDSEPLFLPLESSAKGLPAGSSTGQIVHQILEKVFKCKHFNPLNAPAIQILIERESKGTEFEAYREELLKLILGGLQTPLLPCGAAAKDIAPEDWLCETEFLFSWEGTLIKGVADLIFRYEGKIYLLDWKTNDLGSDRECYSPAQIENAMQAHGYYFQASLYAEALKRYVKQLDMGPFEEIFGGALYLFLRGPACHHFIPKPLELFFSSMSGLNALTNKI